MVCCLSFSFDLTSVSSSLECGICALLSCKTFELCADVSVPQAQILSELSLIPESQMNTLGWPSAKGEALVVL